MACLNSAYKALFWDNTHWSEITINISKVNELNRDRICELITNKLKSLTLVATTDTTRFDASHGGIYHKTLCTILDTMLSTNVKSIEELKLVDLRYVFLTFETQKTSVILRKLSRIVKNQTFLNNITCNNCHWHVNEANLFLEAIGWKGVKMIRLINVVNDNLNIENTIAVLARGFSQCENLQSLEISSALLDNAALRKLNAQSLKILLEASEIQYWNQEGLRKFLDRNEEIMITLVIKELDKVRLSDLHELVPELQPVRLELVTSMETKEVIQKFKVLLELFKNCHMSLSIQFNTNPAWITEFLVEIAKFEALSTLSFKVKTKDKKGFKAMVSGKFPMAEKLLINGRTCEHTTKSPNILNNAIAFFLPSFIKQN